MLKILDGSKTSISEKTNKKKPRENWIRDLFFCFSNTNDDSLGITYVLLRRETKPNIYYYYNPSGGLSSVRWHRNSWTLHACRYICIFVYKTKIIIIVTANKINYIHITSPMCSRRGAKTPVHENWSEDDFCLGDDGGKCLRHV